MQPAWPHWKIPAIQGSFHSKQEHKPLANWSWEKEDVWVKEKTHIWTLGKEMSSRACLPLFQVPGPKAYGCPASLQVGFLQQLETSHQCQGSAGISAVGMAGSGLQRQMQEGMGPVA